MNMLKINNLKKSFGNNEVLNDISFEVPQGSIFGFIGQNGAGKTTTMKIILGLLKPDSGEVYVNDELVTYGQNLTNKYIGYLPDVPEFYSYMNAYEYLKMCGEITGMKSCESKQRMEELLNMVGLSNVKKKIGGYSRGMKQRLGIAQALLNSPKLLICDEPTSALDPIGRKELLDILMQVKNKTTVMFSTHILSDVERICDRIAVINNGTIQMQGTINEIKSRHKKESINIGFREQQDMKKYISEIDRLNIEAVDVDKSDLSVTIHSKNIDGTMRRVMNDLVKLNIVPKNIDTVEPTLENLFMEVVENDRV